MAADTLDAFQTDDQSDVEGSRHLKERNEGKNAIRLTLGLH